MIIIHKKLFIFLGLLVAGILSVSLTTPLFAQEEEAQEETVKADEEATAAPDAAAEGEGNGSAGDEKDSQGNDEGKKSEGDSEGGEN